MCYYPKKKALFSGDFIYECGHGSTLYDWTPRASIEDYLKSAKYIVLARKF
jgi:glyoxylase-like metal-dependent hydrolase (beta-lactamase superfamily II)